MLLALTVSLLASGCGKDKTLDQYQRDQANAALAQQQIAAGVCRGTLVNQGTGQPMGALELRLNATAVPISDGSGTGSASRAILQGYVKVVSGSQQTSAVITTGGYVPSSDSNSVGVVTGTVNVALGSNTPAAFTLNAHFDNGHLSGVITPADRSGTAGSFSCNRDAPLPHVGQGSTLPGADASKYYSGVFQNHLCSDPKFKDTIWCRRNENSNNVKMTVNMNPSSSGIAFVNLFADVKSYLVQVSFNNVVFSMPGAEFNPTASPATLNFQGKADGDTTQSTLACTAEGTGYSCTFRNEGGGETYDFHLAQQISPPGR